MAPLLLKRCHYFLLNTVFKSVVIVRATVDIDRAFFGACQVNYSDDCSDYSKDAKNNCAKLKNLLHSFKPLTLDYGKYYVKILFGN